MAERNSLLLIYSGISAFVIYFFILFLIVFNFSSFFTIKYIPKSSTILEQSISIDLSNLQETQDDKNSGTPLEGLGLKEIFSSIPDMNTTPKINGDDRSKIAKNSKDKIEKNKLQNIQEQITKINQNLNNLQQNKKTLDIQSQSISPDFASGEYNEWFTKIYDIIYKKWNSSFYQNALVSVLLQINDKGEFRYRIVKLSQYDDYNQSVINLLESLKDEKFPPYPEGKLVNIEVNFKVNLD